ncbi:unnamed protein product, partial [Urochloa humidicola]
GGDHAGAAVPYGSGDQGSCLGVQVSMDLATRKRGRSRCRRQRPSPARDGITQLRCAGRCGAGRRGLPEPAHGTRSRRSCYCGHNSVRMPRRGSVPPICIGSG